MPRQNLDHSLGWAQALGQICQTMVKGGAECQFRLVTNFVAMYWHVRKQLESYKIVYDPARRKGGKLIHSHGREGYAAGNMVVGAKRFIRRPGG